MHLLSFLVLALSLFQFSHAHGLAKIMGINCRGSFKCMHEAMWWDPIPKYLDIALEAVKPTGTLLYGNSTTYHRGQHIICRGPEAVFGTTCLFLEGENVPKQGVPMQIVIERLAMLKEHGCKICGSVPLSIDNNPLRFGWLTVNYVMKPRCGMHSLCIAVRREGWVRGAIEGPHDKPSTLGEVEYLERLFESDQRPRLENRTDSGNSGH